MRVWHYAIRDAILRTVFHCEMRSAHLSLKKKEKKSIFKKMIFVRGAHGVLSSVAIVSETHSFKASCLGSPGFENKFKLLKLITTP
jgi:hypothetical protein